MSVCDTGLQIKWKVQIIFFQQIVALVHDVVARPKK